MARPSPILSNRSLWLVNLRWIACLGVVATVWTSSSRLGILATPSPLYAVAGAMAVYNSLFWLHERRRSPGGMPDRSIFGQIALDQIALTLLLYFADMTHNPFVLYFVFHMIIATLLLPGWAPYVLAGLATSLFGAVLLSQHLGWIPSYPLTLDHIASTPRSNVEEKAYRVGLFVAFASTLWITVYFTSSVHHYMRRTQAVVRQKEKMLGIGQLVAGFAHQINNPLDGVQNCLRTIAKGVKGDQHLEQYVEMMAEALDRIEGTAKRVQAFARPRGLKLQPTDVNAAVGAAAGLLGASHHRNVAITVAAGNVSPVRGDTYTLQEVIFNLCTNALAAMPDGGTLSIRTRPVKAEKFGGSARVAIEVADTGVGIPEDRLERIFEPFFTTRAEAGGTGLGLGLCRMLISEMGGHIEVESRVGQGATFRVVLSAATEDEMETDDENSGC